MTAVVIDTETTGKVEPVAIEVAYIQVESPLDEAPHDPVVLHFNPGKPIEWGAMATHHMMDHDVAQYPPTSAFRLPEGTVYIVGHNVDFDWEAIGRPDVKRICTVALGRKLWPGMDSHGLGALLYMLEGARAKERLRGAHSAGVDTVNCRVLLWYILRQLERAEGARPDTWEALWSISEAARVPETMPFGKHKGMRIADVPPDYKAWLLRQDDVDVYLRKALSS